MAGDAAPATKVGKTVASGCTGHPQVVSHRDQEWAAVDVAGLRPGVDLEYRPARMGKVDRIAVVHHALKDAQGAYAHDRMLPGWSAVRLHR
jgi:hypothetical protein